MSSPAPTRLPAPAPTAVAHGGPGRDLPDDRGLLHPLDVAAATDPDRTVLVRPDGVRRSAADLQGDVHRAARRLLAAGLAAGERVVILGATGHAWIVADLAVLAVGGVVVPVYPTSSPEQVAHTLADSGAVLALADTADGRAVLDGCGTLRTDSWALEDLARVLDAPDPDAADPDPADPDPADPDPADPELDVRRRAVRADDLATIVYTSGTTGAPKGCLLTHRAMYVAAAGVVDRQPEMFGGTADEQAATVLALPLSHVFGRTLLFACLVGGTAMTPVPGVADMVPVLPSARPTFLVLVPYALEKLRKRGATAFGGRLRHVICGGASLEPSTREWFDDAGVTIYQAYGLTETATATTLNGPGVYRPATVGRPIPGVTVAIAGDGEILVAGANVSPGYWGRGPEPGDGWLHTGDLGALDEDGFLTITGRRKEILVTSGGKNVAPAPLEDRIRLHPLVSQAMVLGDGRSYVTALVTLEPTADVSPEDPAVVAAVGEAVDAANTTVSRAESVRRFRIVAGDFSVAAGQLTPSMKLRRAQIERDFADDVAALYA